jgi:hypothetical protein
VIRSPFLAARGGAGYVVGNDIGLYDSLPLPARPLAAFDLHGAGIGRPEGDFYFASPRALIAADGTLHLVWAEPGEWKPLVREDWIRMIGDAASLWHATYAPARGWSPPQPIHAATRLWWSEGLGEVVMDSAGTLHGVVGEEPGDRLLHLSSAGGRWKAEPIPGVTRPVYGSIAAGSDGRIYVAFVAADRSVPADGNSVFLIRSEDGGRSWSGPRLIRRSGERRATAIRVLVSRSGSVHLVWAQNLSGGLAPQVIRHVASSDGGETWSPPNDADIPDGLGTLMAAVDGCGALHVIWETVEETDAGEAGRLWHARWDGAWGEVELPFGTLNSTDADLTADPDGSLRLFWSVVQPGSTPAETTFRPVTSTLPAGP